MYQIVDLKFLNQFLGLIDVLDTLAIMGNKTEFQKAVQLVLENVSFDKNNVVQVFEANIRVLGGLLSAHLLMEDTNGPFKDLMPDWYAGDLLTLAHDLADRLILAFDQTESGKTFWLEFLPRISKIRKIRFLNPDQNPDDLGRFYTLTKQNLVRHFGSGFRISELRTY